MPKTKVRTTRLDLWLSWVTRHPVTVVTVCVILTALALYMATTRLGINSDPIDMLDEELPFRQAHEQYQRQFPSLNNTLLAVIEAPSPEQATLAARQVRDRLRQHPEVVNDIFWPAGSSFFETHGLLFLPLEQLVRLSDRLVEFQPFLGQLATETHAATLLDLLTQLERNAESRQLNFDRDLIYPRLAHVIDARLEGQAAMLSWQKLLSPSTALDAKVARETLLINPVLDHERVLAGREIIRTLDEIRTQLGLDKGLVRLRLTGRVALRHEELQSLMAGASLAGTLALLAVSTILLVGFRSLRLSVIALINLLFGLSLTAGFAALAIGRVNPISVAFVVLYVGLGANYAAHYLFRYREIAVSHGATDASIHAAARFLVRPLLLSAVTTALGFFAFMPTGFSGVAELGLIAGVAMVITLVLSYSALPALLALFRPPARVVVENQRPFWQRLQVWPLRHRQSLLVGGGLLALGAATLLPLWEFDADPLGLRDPESESVQTLRELLVSGEGGYRNAQVLVAPQQQTEPMRSQLASLASVDRALSIDSLIPNDQPEKLARIEELTWVLGPDIMSTDWQVEELSKNGLESSVESLLEALGAPPGKSGQALAASLERLGEHLRQSPPNSSLVKGLNQALVGGLAITLGPISKGLSISEPVGMKDLPEWFRRQWVGRDGTQLIQVYPAGDMGDFDRLEAFTRDVQTVAGDSATGGPVLQIAAGEAVTDAFRQALGWALASIVLILLLALRSVTTTLKVLAPLIMGGILTGASMALFNISLNFANVVALPLLLGVAVDNGIHLVLRHRDGGMPEGNVLRTATARAIVFGALITLGGFGNLLFSPHAGTASLGLILTVGLGLMVVATLIFLPAALGRGSGTDST